MRVPPIARIVLVAGRLKVPDRVGHHDYVAGCALLARLLAQTPGVEPVLVRDGWPEDERVFDGASALVFYCGGGGKQPFLRSPERIARLQALVDRGVGVVMLHQAVDYPPDRAALGARWLGGSAVHGETGRGHWKAQHRDLPAHPVTRGVEPFALRDGWLNEIRFVPEMRGVAPLLWAARRDGSRSADDVVAWAYERPGGGRSFCFSGLDAHAAWAVPSVRQLVVNGALWSAGLAVPGAGAPCAADAATLRHGLASRGSRPGFVLAALRKQLRRVHGRGETSK